MFHSSINSVIHDTILNLKFLTPFRPKNTGSQSTGHMHLMQHTPPGTSLRWKAEDRAGDQSLELVLLLSGLRTVYVDVLPLYSDDRML